MHLVAGNKGRPPLKSEYGSRFIFSNMLLDNTDEDLLSNDENYGDSWTANHYLASCNIEIVLKTSFILNLSENLCLAVKPWRNVGVEKYRQPSTEKTLLHFCSRRN